MTGSTIPNADIRSEQTPVGGGFTISFTFRDRKLEAHWEPRVPVGRKGRKYLPAYRLARDEFLARVARRTGLSVAVVEL